MFGKKAAESEAFQEKLNSDHHVADIFTKKYIFVDPEVTNGDKKPTAVIDEDGREYMYRILPSYSKIYESLYQEPIEGVPKVVEIVKFERKTHVIEEKVEGITLYNNGQLDEKEAYNYILQLCDILEKLHGRGIVHNDIKPSNIMLDNNDKIWLIDFDGAKLIDREKLSRLESTKLPDTENHSSIILTERYATVEQIHGCPVEETDISLLGQTFLDLLPYDYNGALKNVLEKCSDPNYKIRYRNAKDLIGAIQIAKHPYNIIEWINFQGNINGELFIKRMVFATLLLVWYKGHFDIGHVIATLDNYQLGLFKAAALLVFPLIQILKYSTFAKRIRDMHKSAYLCLLVLAFDIWSYDFGGIFNVISDRVYLISYIILLCYMTVKK